MTNYYNFEKFIMIATKFRENYITRINVYFHYIIFKLNQRLRHS